MSFIVLYGSPAHGFKAHGPFPTDQAALDWGEKMGEGGETIMEVHSPDADGPPLLYPWDT